MDEHNSNYQIPEIPHNEAERILELHALKLLDSESERVFDNYTQLVSDILGEGICLISLVDRSRQWFKSTSCDFASETGRDESFCTHIVAYELNELVVPDTLLDETFKHNPLVAQIDNDYPIRAYAGVPIYGPQGFILGSLCVIADVPVDFKRDFIHTLKCVAQKISSEIAFRGKALKEKRQYLQSQLFDSTTKLPNKEYFFTQINACTEQQYSCTPAYLALIEIERFHYMHSVYGESLTEYMLNQIVIRTRLVLPPNALFARCEKSLFALFIPVTVLAIEDVLAVVKDAFEDAVHYNEKTIFATTRISYSDKLFDFDKLDWVFNNVKVGLEQETNPRYGDLFNASNVHSLAQKALEIENALRLAIQQNAFTLVYQPIVESYTEAVIGMEALVRWRWKPNEYLSPAEFIPIAEEAGLILPLSQWIIKTACIEFSGLQDSVGFPLYLSVNISPTELASPDFISFVKEALHSSGMEPAQLQLEITEHALMSDFATTKEVLSQLQSMGIRIALDDFGTGHSSLQYLQQLPIDTIKIDRSFICEINDDSCESPVMRAIIAVGHELGLGLTAEGIETPAQAAFIRHHHIGSGQGYFYSKPKPIRELLFEIAAPVV